MSLIAKFELIVCFQKFISIGYGFLIETDFNIDWLLASGLKFTTPKIAHHLSLSLSFNSKITDGFMIAK